MGDLLRFPLGRLAGIRELELLAHKGGCVCDGCASDRSERSRRELKLALEVDGRLEALRPLISDPRGKSLAWFFSDVAELEDDLRSLWLASFLGARSKALAARAPEVRSSEFENRQTWFAASTAWKTIETELAFRRRCDEGKGTPMKVVFLDPGTKEEPDRDRLGAAQPSPLPRPSVGGGGEPVPGPGTVNPLPPGVFKPIPFNTRNVQSVMLAQLNAREPRVVRWLVSTVNAEKGAIKFAELRNAVRDGDLPREWAARWRQAYSAFVNERLAPQWEALFEQAAAMQARRYAVVLGIDGPGLTDVLRRVDVWAKQHAAELAVNLSSSQEAAARAIIRRFAASEMTGAAELGRVLRPVIGLTEKGANAVFSFDQSLQEAGVATAKREARVRAYAGRLLRVRAERIARTELSFAWNQAALESIRVGVERGDIVGAVDKVFMTAKDEKVCEFCEALEGQSVGLGETFPGVTERLPNVYMPPVHPNCRCTVGFELLEMGDLIDLRNAA